MLDRLRLLFDTRDFNPRWSCGHWTEFHGWIHILADLAIWAAYISIPLAIIVYVVRRPDTPLPRLGWLFAAFIFLCGTTHLMDAATFWWPAYRLSALLKVLTALASMATVMVSFARLPQLIGFPSLAQLNSRLMQSSEAQASMERALTERSNLLQIALAAGDAGAWSYDCATRRWTRYSALSKLLGLPEENVTESPEAWQARIVPEDRASASAVLDDAMRNPKFFAMQYRLIRADGEKRWVSSRGDVVTNRGGAPVGLAGIVTDITADRIAAAATARLGAIVRSAPDAIIALSMDGVITEWNGGAEKLYGYKPEEIVGSHIERLVPQARRDEVAGYLKAAAAKESTGPLETVRRGRDGRLLPIELVVAPIVDDSEQVVGISKIERDISDRHDINRKLRVINRALEQRSDEVEQFLYTVTHDLKAPLVTIQGFTGVITEEMGAQMPESIRDPLSRIERAAYRMTSLIDDLLEVSRVGRTPYRSARVDTAALAAEVRADFADELAEKKVELLVQGALPELHADPIRLRQVLDNLVSNAIKYGCPASPAKIEIGGQMLEDEVQLYVRDFGPGIPEKYRERVFQLFQRLSPAGEGTGLGLALVRRIMQAHGGRAWISDTPGQGATVWLAFPRARDKGSDDELGA